MVWECDWSIQYHLCSTYRGLWGLVVVRLSWLSDRVRAAQARDVLVSTPGNYWPFHFLPHNILFPAWGKMLLAVCVSGEPIISWCYELHVHVDVTPCNISWYYELHVHVDVTPCNSTLYHRFHFRALLWNSSTTNWLLPASYMVA